MAYNAEGDTVKRIKEAVDLVDLISGYLPLNRAGTRFKALCPFHEEKTPSFYVNPDTQTWRCFGCQKAGDVFDFLEERDHLAFPEALEFLSQRTGIPLQKGPSRGDGKSRLRQYELLERACKRFQALLESQKGKVARDYLQKRGIDEASVARFRLGWSLNDWSSMVQFLTARGSASRAYSLDEIEKVGLAKKRQGGSGAYDLFRARVMIPIRDAQGRVVGFGGRVLDDSTPKYVNSTETDIFRKRSLLFGFDEARKDIHEVGHAVLVEGYTDVISAHQRGLANVVATLGTALTEEQCRFLKRHTDRVVLVYDGDSAGQKAADRALPLLLGAGLDVRVFTLDQGVDPGDYFGANDRACFERDLSSRGLSAVEFRYQTARTRHGALEADAATRQIGKEVVELIAVLEDPIAKEVAVRRSCELLGVKEQTMNRAIDHRLGKARPRRQQGLQPAPSRPSSTESLAPRTRAEREIIASLLRAPRTIDRLEDNEGPLTLLDPKAEFVRQVVCDFVRSREDDVTNAEDGSLAHELIEILRDCPDVRSWALEVLDTVPVVDPERVVDGALEHIAREARRAELGAMREREKKRNPDGRSEPSDEFLREFMRRLS